MCIRKPRRWTHWYHNWLYSVTKGSLFGAGETSFKQCPTRVCKACTRKLPYLLGSARCRINAILHETIELISSHVAFPRVRLNTHLVYSRSFDATRGCFKLLQRRVPTFSCYFCIFRLGPC